MASTDTSIYSSLIEISRPMKRRKVLLLGAPETGKSAFLMRFKENVFVEVYEPTIQNSTKKFLPFRNEYVELDITDLDGQTEYTIYSPNKYSFGVNGYLLIYSVNNRASFELLKTINNKLNSIVGKKFPKIIIGNKSDLEEEREVSYHEGKQFAESISCPFLESSVKDNINVQKGFLTLLIEINKIENNFDINAICCPKIFQCFIKKENCVKYLCYIFFILNILIAIGSLLLGMKAALLINLDVDMHSFIPMIIGLWSIIFSVFGYIGLKNQKADIMNINVIGITVGILIALAGMISFALLHLKEQQSETEFEEQYNNLMKIYEFIITPMIIFFNLIVLLFSFIYKKIFELDLLSYII